MPRDVPGHYPIILRYPNQLWGPKPFPFNKHWFSHPHIPELVCISWYNSHFCGWKDFVLKENLKALKGALKSWNDQVFCNFGSHIASLRGEVDSLDARVDHRGFLWGRLTLGKRWCHISGPFFKLKRSIFFREIELSGFS